MKRGEIWLVGGGKEYAGKPRPTVILQSDEFDATDSVTVCPFTSDPTDAWKIRPLVEPTAENGLRRPSRLMVDKVMTIRRDKLGRRIGVLSRRQMSELGSAVILLLGLAR